ncbi:methylenetetrahydrofolate reductase [Rhodobacter capsulatus]|jgi:methylenetetrahydrofolate reductase (NADPH)|uniref:Methylenetetrahydrofolate reductase family protein n=1 Tax=Rhodobacter capsulatus (strain ATCC BAA-309 / NBRC 16581 / SB1003) TaxID=272942 RepID=D5ATS1_RHOCB|nr:methylenetetrahydrofolate reductase [Rhodobacter capsulatus]ADE85360.1 methylenetetrahydrofolate reductase family protein [Rhodobacter capsulatus SB 1003]ETD01403.1 methylenetetrahydrofolate reductase [Rhodobacter capsulatus DE442]ETD77116.1 methylenetetrahydrofolate reductase [Rhodobacter capsulatus R121]ETE53820.1 methylenetetrahydrofolate reductase [Rhodobacter capsulatus Y262]MDS0927071.1 methylenetetrahydrofolate reductase [Rhodobacter capsulatus]
MALLNFRREAETPTNGTLTAFLDGFSIEVMPRTAEKIEDFRALLPAGTRVYVAHIEGTPIEEMVATAKRLRDEGFEPMPHFPARIIRDALQLRDWVARYKGEAGVKQALLLGGGVKTPVGSLDNAMQLVETGAFAGFERLHFAGHPEGNRDIDADGTDEIVMQALALKQKFADTTDADTAIVTQFAFEAGPIIQWVDRLAAEGIRMPVHIGIAGPAKLQTLLKFAISCGVGPSLKVLQKRAKDVTKLLTPFEPTDLLMDLARHKAKHPDFGIEAVHFFPLGGIKTNATWIADKTKG